MLADRGPAALPYAHRAHGLRSARATGDERIARHHGPDICKRHHVGHRARPRGGTVLIVAGHRLLSWGWPAATLGFRTRLKPMETQVATVRPESFEATVDEDLRRQYACRCASVACRRSMLADVA